MIRNLVFEFEDSRFVSNNMLIAVDKPGFSKCASIMYNICSIICYNIYAHAISMGSI
jgi:hypothetical protein